MFWVLLVTVWETPGHSCTWAGSRPKILLFYVLSSALGHEVADFIQKIGGFSGSQRVFLA